MIKNAIFLEVLILILTLSVCYGAPVITGVSGTVSDGNLIIITGLDFGVKSPAMPQKWTKFEEGIDGDSLPAHDSDWIEYDGGSPPHYAAYSSSEKHSGSLSAYNDPVARGKFSTCYYSLSSQSDEVFVSYWFKAVSTVVGSPDGYMVGKQFRIGDSTYSTNPPYSGPGAKLSDYRANEETGPWLFYNPGDGGIPENEWKRVNIPWNKWTYIEFYIKLSDPPGTANGQVYAKWCDGDNCGEQKFTNVITRKSGYSFQLDSVWLGLAADNFNSDVFDLQVYTDDIYIDNTQSRVVMGDLSTFSTCKHKEIQIPSAWSDTSITITVNQGSFNDGDTAYLFVVDSNGDISNGYQITFGNVRAKHLCSGQANFR